MSYNKCSLSTRNIAGNRLAESDALGQARPERKSVAAGSERSTITGTTGVTLVVLSSDTAGMLIT